MKKSYLVKFFLLSVLILGFVACGSDDDDPTAAEQSEWIVGDWIVDSNTTPLLLTYKFNANGTFIQSVEQNNANSGKISDPAGQYRITETNKLELKYDNKDQWEAQKFKMNNKDSFYLDDIKYVKRK